MLGAVGGLGLDLNLPGAAEQVQIVDEIAAERGLQGLEHGVQRHAEDLRLVAIDIEIDRWIGGRERGEHAAELRVLVGRHGQAAHHLRQGLWIAAAQVLQHIAEAAAGAEADDGRRRERQHRAAGNLPEFRTEPLDQCRSRRTPRPLRSSNGFKRHHDEGRVGLRIVVDEVQPDDGGDVRDRGFRAQHRLGLAHDLGGARDRGAAGQLHDDEECALIVLRQEAGRA